MALLGSLLTTAGMGFAIMLATTVYPLRAETKSASILIAQAPPAQTPATAPPPAVQTSGLPVPRYVSLKSDRVHVRQGPGTDHKVLWVYRRAGLPVEIIKEFDGWRQIRDAEGVTGWVLQSLVSGRRTVLILPWEAKGAALPQIPLRSDDSESSQPVAIVEAGVLGSVRSCDGKWCLISVGDHRGYVEQKKLWGVYDGEKFR